MSPRRCNVCKKRVNFNSFVCRCSTNKVFCSKHRIDHDCKHDYHNEYKMILQESNKAVVKPKVDTI